MNNILLLIKSYFHKAKGQAASLIILILIAVMLLNIGFLMQAGISTFFDERAEELNSPHFATVVDSALDVFEVEQFLNDHEKVVAVERSEVLFTTGDIFVGDHVFLTDLILMTEQSDAIMNPLTLIGDYLPLAGDIIYIPHFLMVDNEYELGDQMRLTFGDRDIWFTIGGSTEEILFGSLILEGVRFYISDEKFDELLAEFPDTLHMMLTARCEQYEDGLFLLNDFRNESFTQDDDQSGVVTSFAMFYEEAKAARLMLPTILGVTVIALAAMLLIVSAVVVRFRINSIIEEQVKNLGILKAVGYENRQIISSLLVQFGSISLVGALFGLIATTIMIPLVRAAMEGQLGLLWQPGLNLPTAILVLVATIGLILLITYLSARRIKKLYPIVALRENIATHNFKKNYFCLEKSKGALTMLLSFKHMISLSKQMVMIVLIVAGLTFSAFASLTMYYNMVVDIEAFGKMVAGNISDVVLILRDTEDVDLLKERIAKMPEVEHIYGMIHGGEPALVNELNISLMIVEDSKFLQEHTLVEGRFPNHANEIAISPVMANTDDFAIGEVVTLRRGNFEEEFLITGVMQNFYNSGLFSLLTSEGFRRVEPNFAFHQLSVDLIEGEDIDEFIDKLAEVEGDIFYFVLNFWGVGEAQLAGMTATITPVVFGNVMISGLVIALVLYMIIKPMITRRHMELGIQKALGFTNIQLMNQISISLLPIIVAGTVIGGILGYFYFSSLVVALISGEGIAVADFPIPLSWVIVLVVGLSALSYGAAMVIARRIRKISAYALVSDG